MNILEKLAGELRETRFKLSATKPKGVVFLTVVFSPNGYHKARIADRNGAHFCNRGKPRRVCGVPFYVSALAKTDFRVVVR